MLSGDITKMFGAFVLALSLITSARATEELNALVWCDHTDPNLIEPFEKKHNVKVNLKEYEGTGAALAIIEQSRPGDWDVLVVDSVDVPRLIDTGLLAPLPAAELPVDDLFAQARMRDVTWRDGKMYAITEKFGYNVISYNSSKVDPADMRDLNMIWSDKYKGRVAVYDYDIPIVGLVALKQGMTPAEVTMDNLGEIRQDLLKLKENAVMVGDVVASATALATGEADILIGGGEWATAVLNSENPQMEWVQPDQGGMFWSQSLALFETSEKKDLATKFIQYVMSPEGQARLATSSCYWAMPANRKAEATLSPAEKKTLRWDEQPDFLAKAHRYFVPDADLQSKILDLWTEFLQH